MDAIKLFFGMLLGVFQVLLVVWPLWLVLALLLFGRLALVWRKRARLAKSGIAELDQLTGEAFEHYLVLFFGKLGYQVHHTPLQGDYGADLVLQKDGRQTVVQAKRHSRAVGIKAVQEVVAAKEYYRCSHAMVVTNQYFSQAAQKLAQANQVELWDRDSLAKQMLTLKTQTPLPELPINPAQLEQTSVDAISNVNPLSNPVCATCGKTVSPQVQRYCLSHTAIFKGKIYCYAHQNEIQQNGRPPHKSEVLL